MLKIAVVGAALWASVILTATAEPQGPADTPLVIDVRTPAEYRTSHVAGALNIPYEQIATRIAAVVPDRQARIVLYCRSGRRSDIALHTLKEMGYHRAENRGGLADVMPSVGDAP